MNWFDKNMKIKSSEICKSEADKTRGTWFIYEFSNSLYDALVERLEDEYDDYYDNDEALICSVLSKKELKSFSISMANKALDIIRQWKLGHYEKVIISTDLIKSLLNKKGSSKVINSLAKLVTSNLYHLLEICKSCPGQCIINPDEKSYMFDHGPY